MGSSAPIVYLLIHHTFMAVLLRQSRYIYKVYLLLVSSLLTHDDTIWCNHGAMAHNISRNITSFVGTAWAYIWSQKSCMWSVVACQVVTSLEYKLESTLWMRWTWVIGPCFLWEVKRFVQTIFMLPDSRKAVYCHQHTCETGLVVMLGLRTQSKRYKLSSETFMIWSIFFDHTDQLSFKGTIWWICHCFPVQWAFHWGY